MSSYVFKDVFLSIDGTALSAYVKQVTLNFGAEAQDASSVMGATGTLNTRIFLPGLRTWSIDIDFLQSFTGSEVDSIIYAAHVKGTVIAFVFRPTVAAKGLNNPEYGGSGVIESYTAVSGNVGEVATAKLSMKAGSVITRLTA
jgi:hypothetical protein